jgi:hypothetical protein
LFYVTCLVSLVGSDSNCDVIRNIIGGLLISSALCIFVLGSKKIYSLAALSNNTLI